MSTEPVGISGDRAETEPAASHKRSRRLLLPVAAALVVGKGFARVAMLVAGGLWKILRFFSFENCREEEDVAIAAGVLATASVGFATIHSVCQKFEFTEQNGFKPDDGSILTFWNLGFLIIFLWSAGPFVGASLIGLAKTGRRKFSAALAKELDRLQER